MSFKLGGPGSELVLTKLFRQLLLLYAPLVMQHWSRSRNSLTAQK
jgi:hypothetical protein